MILKCVADFFLVCYMCVPVTCRNKGSHFLCYFSSRCSFACLPRLVADTDLHTVGRTFSSLTDCIRFVHASLDQASFEVGCMSPTAASALRSKQQRGGGGVVGGTHLSDLRHSWSQCAPKMVKALSTASADDARNSSTGLGRSLALQ